MPPERWDVLACGSDPARLLNLAVERTPLEGHEATCPYCRATTAELEHLWLPVREWAGRKVVLPRSFLARVIRRVQRMAQSPRHVASATPRGATTVTSWVLGLLASTATRDTAGVTAITTAADDRPVALKREDRRRAIRYGADGVEVTEVGAAAVSVALGLHTVAAPSLIQLADDVRGRVIAAIEGYASIEVADVDLSIDEVDFDSWRDLGTPQL